MRSLYWKIFLSFWLATILIILTTVWFTSQMAKKSSLPAHERVFMDSYATAAVATFESGKKEALRQWLEQVGLSRHMTLYLLSDSGDIVSSHEAPKAVKETSEAMIKNELHEGIFKKGKLIVSHEILTPKGNAYRLAAISEKPLPHFIQIPWAGLAIRLAIAIFFSGLICYLLSLYLTHPLTTLSNAAKSIAKGKLSTRVGPVFGHGNDEIADLTQEFDSMAEKLEAMVKSKERLLQDISHELRSPLARMNIAVELGRNKTGKIAESEFNRIETEAHRLNDLITEILEYARLEKSATNLNLSHIDIKTLLESIIQDANYEFRNNHIQLDVLNGEDWTMMADQRLIHRAIENILRNALRYSTQESSVIVCLQKDKTNQEMIIQIKDRGPGVPEDQLKIIFNPFYRVDSSREKKTGGYGLGLAIANQAIKLHQGKISAKNREHGGLSVQISLPFPS